MLIYINMIEQRKDRSRFEEFYNTYKGLMFHAAEKILGNPQDTEDAVHDAFLYIAKNFSKIFTDDRHKTVSFVVTIVVNKAIDIYRKKRRHPAIEYDEAFTDKTVNIKDVNDMAGALLKLPIRYRNFLLLKYEQGYSNEELAEMLNISQAGVRKLNERAKIMFEKICREEGLL